MSQYKQDVELQNETLQSVIEILEDSLHESNKMIKDYLAFVIVCINNFEYISDNSNILIYMREVLVMNEKKKAILDEIAGGLPESRRQYLWELFDQQIELIDKRIMEIRHG